MHALVVCTAALPGTVELVANCAETADLMLGVDGGAAHILEAGLVPDVVVGDFDSLPTEAASRLRQLGVPEVRYPADKDRSDLDLALETVKDAGAERVTVTGAFSARLDHTLAALGSLVRFSRLAPEIAEPGFHGWLLSSAGRASLDLRSPGATLSLLALDGPATVSITGVRWPLEWAELQPLSSHGISNVVSELASLTVHAGKLLVLDSTQFQPVHPDGIID